MDLVTIFYEIDNFCKGYEKYAEENLLPSIKTGTSRSHRMSLSEIISVLAYYGSVSHIYKTFKAFYTHSEQELKSAFPGLVSYTRMIELKEKVQVPLAMFLIAIFGENTGISFIDSTPIEACNIKRTYNHKVLAGIASKGKSSKGWFFGFKLHLIVNHFGSIVRMCITTGSIADNNNELIRMLTKGLTGRLFGDKGYILNPNLWKELYQLGLKIIHGLRANMKNKTIMPVEDKILLRKRASMSEGVFSILKDRMSLQYTKSRSRYGFFCNILIMLIAYQLRPKKPSVKFYATNDDASFSDKAAILAF
jgi:hypothetical protein